MFAQGDTAAVLTSEKLSALMNEPIMVQRAEDGTIGMTAQVPSRLWQLCYGKQVKENGR